MKYNINILLICFCHFLIKGRKFAMYFILPRTTDGLDYVIKNVNSFILSRHVGMMQRLPVEVTIPRFKFEFTTHFESILREVNINIILIFFIQFSYKYVSKNEYINNYYIFRWEFEIFLTIQQF